MAASVFVPGLHVGYAGRLTPQKLQYGAASSKISLPSLPALFKPSRTNRFARRLLGVMCCASSVGGFTAEPEENPYQVLGVSPFERFDKIKASYTKRHRDAEKKGDEATLSRIEKAYDKIMMAQLANRKQGLTFGSVEVSKDIRYADKRPLLPWGPRFAPSSKRDILINLAISAVFVVWIICTQSADWKPLQFVIFGYIWRVFNKLKDYEPVESPPPSEEEDQGRQNKSGKRLLRTLALVFSCIAASSLVYTGLLNAIELSGLFIPRVLISGQELLITTMSSILLFFMGSYYR